MIESGQLYEPCNFRGAGIRIKVIAAPTTTFGMYGYGKCRVATLTPDGREIRPRYIECSQLHDSPTTKAGAPRRTGYHLVKETE